MKFFQIIAFLLCAFAAAAQQEPSQYDSTLAKKLGADEYGMKMYVLVILKTGSNTTATKAEKDSLFSGHLKNIGNLVNKGKMIIAGPLSKNENSYRGIFILDVATLEEASELLQTDPAVKADLLAADLYKWYGSAALPEYLKVHEKIQKVKF